MKKFTAALLGLIIAVSCLSLSGCGDKGGFYENELEVTPDDPYSAIVKQKCETAKKVWNRSGSESKFEQRAEDIYYYLYDIDEDAIPELILGDRRATPDKVTITDIYTSVDCKPVKCRNDRWWYLENVIDREIQIDSWIKTTFGNKLAPNYCFVKLGLNGEYNFMYALYQDGDKFSEDRSFEGEVRHNDNLFKSEFEFYRDRIIDGTLPGPPAIELKWSRIDEYKSDTFKIAVGGRSISEMTDIFEELTTENATIPVSEFAAKYANMRIPADDPYYSVITERCKGMLDDDNEDFREYRNVQNYYCLYDIDGNGVEELLLASDQPYDYWGEENKAYGFSNDSIYTVKDSKPIELKATESYHEFGTGVLGYSCYDRTIYTNGVIRSEFGNKYEPSYGYVRLVDGELTEPELLEYEKGEPYWGMYSNVPYEYRHCYVKDGQGQTDIVTALEYMQRKAEIEKDLVPVELDWRPLEEYGKK